MIQHMIQNTRALRHCKLRQGCCTVAPWGVTIYRI